MVLAAPTAFRYGPGRNVPTAAPAGSQSIDRLELHVLIEDGTCQTRCAPTCKPSPPKASWTVPCPPRGNAAPSGQ